MSTEIDIILKAIDNVSGQIKTVEDSMRRMNKTTQESGLTWTELKSKVGLAKEALATAKQVYEQLVTINVEAYKESAKSQAKLEAVLKSTGFAAGMTANELDNLATHLSDMTGIDDDLIKSTEAMMLTFTQVGKEVFPDTIQAAIDMSAVLDGGVKESVIQIGKAMNDFSGYTALKRAGVSFSEEQIKQIEHFKEINDLASYQQMVMAELKREFSGAAKAANDASDGSENLAVSTGNLREEIGRGLLPQVREANKALKENADTLTEVVKRNNDYTEALTAAGIVRVRGSIYIKDGIRITKEEADALAQAAMEAKRAADAQGVLTGSLGIAQQAHKDGEKAARDQAAAMNDLASETDDAATVIETRMKTIKTAIAQPLEEEEKSYSEAVHKMQEDLTETMGKIAELEALPYLTDEQRDQLDELKKNEGEIQTEYQKTAAAHQRKTNLIKLNLLDQMLAVDGYTAEEAALYDAVAKGMGLAGDQTVAFQGQLGKLFTDFKTGRITADEFVAAILGIPSEKTVTLHVNTIYSDEYRSRGIEGGLMGSSGFPVRDAGGPVRKGQPVAIGLNRRPEIYVPEDDGDIYPISSGGAPIGGSRPIQVNVTLNYSPAISLVDRYEMERRLGPLIRTSLAKMGISR